MKLLCFTERYGDRILVRPSGWGDGIYFAGRQPAEDTMLLLDLPGLEADDVPSIVRWLSQRPPGGLLGRLLPSRRQISELPERVWRPAVLDDVFSADNYRRVQWSLDRAFTLEQFRAFAERYLPEAQQRLRAVLAVSDPDARARALDELHPWIERVSGVFDRTPVRLVIERDAIWRQLDEARAQALRAGRFDLRGWVEAIERMHTLDIQLELLTEVVRHLAQASEDSAALLRALKPLADSATLRRLTAYAPQFWKELGRVLRLKPNVRGATIDITSAEEQRVTLSWDLIEARRVGAIVPGRSALVLDEGSRKTYIAGQRRLKFQVAQAGGRLKKFGNTLVIGNTGASAMHRALLDVDLLDTLANVDPPQALERIRHLHLPPEHPVFQAAEAARDNVHRARVLADLLIELAIGVDADVARRLARAQSRANRR
jgi:hypothetical protein